MNRYYGYDNLFLWDDETWEGRQSSVQPLFEKIAELMERELKEQVVVLNHDAHEEPVYDIKTGNYIYPDVVRTFRERGQSFRLTGMSGADWIGIYPESLDRYEGREPQVLTVLECRDVKDPWSAMKVLEKYRDYTEAVIREGKAVLYFILRGRAKGSYFAFTNVMQEIAAYLHINLTKLYMDVSVLDRHDVTLAEIAGYRMLDVNRGPAAKPEEAAEEFSGRKIRALNISGLWADGTSLTRDVVKISERPDNLDYRANKIIRSQTGKRLAKGFELEYYYDTPEHPEVKRFFQRMGLCARRHMTLGDQWYAVLPRQALEERTKIPAMFLFVEVSSVVPHRVLTAFSNYYEYLELAASGELMLVLFALEDTQSNERMYDIYKEVLETYPADPTRCYVSGFSHNSQLVIDFCHRHHEVFAGLGVWGHGPGYQHPDYSHDLVKITDEMIAGMAGYDMPTINICGEYESEFAKNRGDIHSERFPQLVDAWQRRLRASRCPVQTEEEIAKAQEDSGYITRRTRLYSDRQEIQLMFGLECFINDYRNVDGNYHLRLATVGEQVHTYTPQMPHLTWNFLRRFSRNLQTGEIVELY